MKITRRYVLEMLLAQRKNVASYEQTKFSIPGVLMFVKGINYLRINNEANRPSRMICNSSSEGGGII
jgi:hypothetical protein